MSDRLLYQMGGRTVVERVRDMGMPEPVCGYRLGQAGPPRRCLDDPVHLRRIETPTACP
jgi:hypothetical protein